MDLLDIAQTPNTGADFQGLIRAAAPQAMPFGVNPVAGGMYGNDMARQDQMVQQAAGLAQLQAMMKAKQAEEYMGAGPGRAARIGLGNAEAQDDLSNKAAILGKRRSDVDVGAAKNKTEIANQEFKLLEPFLNAWDKAESYPERQQLLTEMKDAKVTFRGKEVANQSFENVDRLMKSLRNAQENTPKSELTREGYQVKRDVANINAAGAEKRAAMHAALMQHLQGLRDKAAVDRRPVYEKLLEAFSDGKALSDKQLEALNLALGVKTYGSEVRGAGTKPTTTVTPGGGIQTTPAKVPPAPRAGGAPADDAKMKAAVEALGEPYEPDKYFYGINPNTGKLGKRPK